MQGETESRGGNRQDALDCAGDVEDVDGITLRWDPEDKESDPSGEFPFGC